LIVAPAILQEVAQDALIPKLQFFEVTHKDMPLRALIFTSVLSMLVGLTGSLDVVALLLTM
jgi:amino acid transporter